MNTKKEPNLKHKEQRPSILGGFLSKSKKDESYFPELKAQWHGMDHGERIKFVLGAILGLALFIGALVLAYFILAAIAG